MPSVAHLEPFTTETARIAGRKSAQIRNDLVENGRLYKNLAQSLTSVLGSAKSIADSGAQAEVQRQIDVSEEQLAHTRYRLNVRGRYRVRDKERAALLRELRGLMEHLCRLRGIGEPARVRPSNELSVTRRTVPRQLPPSIVQALPDAQQGTPSPPSTPPVVPQEPSPEAAK